MPNVIKYSTTIQPNTIKKGNVLLGVNHLNYGPSNITGFWAGINPPTNGYTIYRVATETSGYTINTCETDNDVIYWASVYGNTGGDNINQALRYLTTGNSNTTIVNKNYENIVTSGLVLNLDATFVPSYPKSGTLWYDICGNNNNGTLTNGSTFSSLSGGSIVFDGVDDWVNIPHNSSLSMTTEMSINIWFSIPQNGLPYRQSLVCKHYRAYELGIYPGGYIHTYTRNGTLGGSYDEGLNAFHPSGDWQANRVYNVTWTLNGNQERAYFEGVIASNGGTYTKANANTGDVGSDLQLGIRLSGDLRYKGNIYSVQIYNRTLSAEEVQQNYNAQKSLFNL